jgi:PEP-CTERM motif
MKNRLLSRVLTAALGVALAATSLSAQISGVSGSTATPPAVFGSYPMTAFGLDAQPFSTTTSVASPLGGLLSFSSALNHVRVGSGWATWSNGYTGDVYWTGETTVTFTLPALTSAFYFYAEPDQFSVFNITATSGTTILAENVDGSAGAKFFGFFTDGSVFLNTISITTTDDTGFAVGEFGIAKGAITPVPEPSTYALFGAASLVGIVAFRRSRQKK